MAAFPCAAAHSANSALFFSAIPAGSRRSGLVRVMRCRRSCFFPQSVRATYSCPNAGAARGGLIGSGVKKCWQLAKID